MLFRSLGQRWLGYDLDAQQRPTFRYTCGAATLEDSVRELVDAQNPTARARLRRTLRATGPDGTTLTLRAARDARIDARDDRTVLVGATLQLQLPAGSFRIRTSGDDAQELLVTLRLADGRAEVVLDYTFVEAGK